jgi:hypothetical protein
MVRLAAAVSPGSANWTPGRKGGRSGSRVGTQGLGPAWNCNECAGRVQYYGAAPWGRSSVRYRTASRSIRSGPPACTAWCVAGMLGRKVHRKATRWRAPVSGRRVDGLGCPRSRSAFKTCLEATQWKVLVTFLSIWLCPDAVSDPRGLAEPRQSDRMARVSWKRRKTISGDARLPWAATLLRAMSQLFVGRVHSSSGVESPSIQD